MLSIVEVNELSYEEFISRFGCVVEHCSLCAAAVWRFRPFSDVRHLHTCIEEFLDQLPLSGTTTGARIAIPDVTYCLYYQGRTALADRADHVIFLLGLKCPLYRGE